ncbi:hypothetical protein GIB67_024960 [Kingdonia uniflora]|uniref:Thioredoxin domain-containing protein n=1 Tax=Kingdonia uniflora TaxID=39325 RepID=A0A7J7NZI4_9MAGN|nr:hypothetical protein GIB67_024960 [Kingdonia uniflora]
MASILHALFLLLLFVDVTVGSRSILRSLDGPDLPDAAVDLNNTDFDSVLTHSPASFAIVEFFAHWCPACRNYKPHYEKVARLFNGPDAVHPGILFMARVDCALKVELMKLVNGQAHRVNSPVRILVPVPESRSSGVINETKRSDEEVIMEPMGLKNKEEDTTGIDAINVPDAEGAGKGHQFAPSDVVKCPVESCLFGTCDFRCFNKEIKWGFCLNECHCSEVVHVGSDMSEDAEDTEGESDEEFDQGLEIRRRRGCEA